MVEAREIGEILDRATESYIIEDRGDLVDEDVIYSVIPTRLIEALKNGRMPDETRLD